ncbi:hypothetical protein GF358_00020 [Candidatus Woesearchaeota archaeon]|nr:hypothetical protein [Candidatus Woesearchaeota archaeon]
MCKMRLVEKAFRQLFPDKEFSYTDVLEYSGRFKGFNANARLNNLTKTITFSLSKNWKGVDEQIKIGLVQSLLLRLFKKKARTVNMDLYDNFIKNLHIAIPKTKSNPVLEESFNRINKLYFAGMIDRPNLRIGKPSARTLGNYDYGTDTITISSLLVPHLDLLDYVMYHEILHKKTKFNSKNGRSFHHTRQFKQLEKAYPNSKELEQKLGRISSKRKILFSLF